MIKLHCVIKFFLKRGGKMAVKLKDIAEKTGYSVNTVSLVMNGKNLVAEKTRKIIEE